MKFIQKYFLVVLFLYGSANHIFSQNQQEDTAVLQAKKIAETLYNNGYYSKALSVYRVLPLFYLNDFKPNKISGTAYISVLFDKDTSYYYANIYKTLFDLLEKYNGKVPLNAEQAKILRNNQNQNLYNVLSLSSCNSYFEKVVLNDIFDYLNQLEDYHDKVNDLLKSKMKASEPKFYAIGNPKKLMKQINFEKVNSRVQEANTFTSIKNLADYLTNGLTEAEKFYAIFQWIRKNIKYIPDSTSNIDVNSQYTTVSYRNSETRITQTAEMVFEKKAAVCEGYSNLFLALCKYAHLNAEFISGFTPSIKSFYGSHAWNIVEINNEYYLVDVTWNGIEYFLSNPVFFNTKHFCSGKRQLLFCPYTQNEFFTGIEQNAQIINNLFPDSLNLIINLSKVYYKQGKYKETVKLLEEKRPEHPDFNYRYRLAEAYSNIQPRKAINIYRELLKIKPNHLNTIYQLATLYKDNFKLDSALYYYKMMLQINPDSQIALRGMAYSYFFMKQYNKANQIANKLYKTAPNNYLNLNLMASIEYHNLNYKKAIEYLEQSLLFMPENINAIRNISMYYRLLGNVDKALHYNSKALIIYPNDIWLKKERASIYSAQKKFEKSYLILKEIIADKKDDIFYLDNMAWYAFLTQRYEEAIKYALEAININERTASYNSLALAYILTNQYKKAEKIYIKMKDKPYLYEPQYNTYGDFFLKWLNFAEQNGIHHPDFEKAKKLLKN